SRGDIASANGTNERYQAVIDRLDAFVSPKSFIIFDSGVSEHETARNGLTEALRLRDGRPVMFRTNGAWRSWGGEIAPAEDDEQTEAEDAEAEGQSDEQLDAAEQEQEAVADELSDETLSADELDPYFDALLDNTA